MSRADTEAMMRRRCVSVMAHLPYDVPGGREGTTVKRLAFELNLSEYQVRHALRTLVGQKKVRRLRVKTRNMGDTSHDSGAAWQIRYAIERK